MKTYESWGRYHQFEHEVYHLSHHQQSLPPLNGKKMLPYGLGRSYGDSCLNDDGILLDISQMNHFLAFDRQTGLLRCEAGVSLEHILNFAVPLGWFLSVTPGTKYVTVGGAIANDVHGKNHHGAGNFGHHVTQFELLRSTGERLICSPTENSEMF